MNNKIIIYGAGRCGKHVLKFLRTYQMQNVVEAFCDRNGHKIREVEGVPVYEFEEREWDVNTAFVIAVIKDFQQEIADLLSQKNQIFFMDFGEWLSNYCEQNGYYEDRKKELLERWKDETNWELNDENEFLNHLYQHDNYLETTINSQSDLCYIFFSSNGLYYPDEKWVVEDVIIQSDYYEWFNISNSEYLKKVAGKYIFVRDVRKTWYVTGVNHKINSISKLVEILKKKTVEKGYRVRTVGSSAGGYMAALVGALLNAEMVFDFSGQFSLYIHDNVCNEYYFLNKYKGGGQSKFYNIVPYIKGKVPIMYFFPYYSDGDFKQSRLVKDFENVYSFAFNESIHGYTVKGRDFPVLLQLSVDDMEKLYNIYKDKLINSEELGITIRKMLEQP